MPKVDGNKDLGSVLLSGKVTLHVPDLPLAYKAKKIYIMLLRIEKKLAKDPLFIPIKDYLYLLDQHEKCNNELIKQGLNTANGRAKARMEQKKLDRLGNKKSEATVGDDQSFGVDNGVSATNPFA